MKNRLNKAVTTLVGADATVAGNLVFDRGCHVGGIVKGDVSAPGNENSELTVAQTGRIEGNAKAARMLIQGTVVGDLRCTGTVTLKSTARVEGSIEYGQIEVEKGAIVKGQLLMSSAEAAGSADAAAIADAATSAAPVRSAAPARNGPDLAPAKPMQPSLS